MRTFWGCTLTFFADDYVFPEISWRGKREDALCDDKLLYAGGKSSIKYACGPSNGSLEEVLKSPAG